MRLDRLLGKSKYAILQMDSIIASAEVTYLQGTPGQPDYHEDPLACMDLLRDMSQWVSTRDKTSVGYTCSIMIVEEGYSVLVTDPHSAEIIDITQRDLTQACLQAYLLTMWIRGQQR